MTTNSDYQTHFVQGVDAMALNKCPMCGALPTVSNLQDGVVMITCSHSGCRVVEGKTANDAVNLWNQPYYAQRA